MRDEKKRRLEASGWRFGSAADFLGLTPAEEAYLDIRLRLAAGLRGVRLRRRLTQTALARAVGSSQSRVAKMETGNPTVSLDLLVRSLLTLGVTRRDLARLITAAPKRPAA